MKLIDHIRYSYYIFKQNKEKSIICLIISLVTSLISLFLLFVAFTFKYNINKLEVKKMEDSEIKLKSSVSKDGIDYYIGLGNKFNTSNTYVLTPYILMNDFSKDKDLDLVLVDGIMPEGNNIISNSNSIYKIGDLVNLEGKDFLVCGLYESEIYDGFIGDLNDLKEYMSYSYITYLYSGLDIISNLNDIENFIDYMDSSDFYSDLLTEYKKSNNNANMVVIILTFCSLLFFAFTFLFFVSSILMSLDESNRFINMLKLLGTNRINLSIIIFLYSFILALIGIVASFIIIFIVSKNIDMSNVYETLIISDMFNDIIVTYEYQYYFPWYIIFFVVFFFFIGIILMSLKYTISFYKKNIMIIKK